VTERLRVVLDTNVFVSAFLSRNPTSPTQEVIQRWLNDEFTLLICKVLHPTFFDLVSSQPHNKNAADRDLHSFVGLLCDLLGSDAEQVPDKSMCACPYLTLTILG
jgi:hypothetical protein